MKGLRFQKRIPLIPGLLYLCLSKSGISLSFGKPGAMLNFRKGRVKGTVGIPGSGLSLSKQINLEDPPGLNESVNSLPKSLPVNGDH